MLLNTIITKQMLFRHCLFKSIQNTHVRIILVYKNILKEWNVRSLNRIYFQSPNKIILHGMLIFYKDFDIRRKKFSHYITLRVRPV